jgi:hydroxypyruvate isomerase
MSKFKQSFCIPCFWKGPEPKDVRAVIEGAARFGFPAVELWFREDAPFDLIGETARGCGMAVSSMCGHRSLGEGLNTKANHRRIRDEILASIEVAKARGISNLLCFSGNRIAGGSDKDGAAITAEGLSQVKDAAEKAGVMLVLELLNSKVDHPNYQCDHTAWGVDVVQRVGSPNVKLLYDIYHMQIMEGDLCRTIAQNIAHIGHFHTAGNPGRHDMDDAQEINYAAVVAAIAATGYDRFVAHEFMPKADKLEALGRAFRLFGKGG